MMSYLLGIDIGTSSIKAVLVDAESARIQGSARAEHPIQHPRPGYAEQNPDDWWQATVSAVRGALRAALVDPAAIRGIGLCGQMHGTVCLDETARPVRPAIIWADGRSQAEIAALLAQAAPDQLARWAPGPPATGFMALSLMWLARHEPRTLDRTYTVLLPKDYVRLILTGERGTEPSDAASTWLFDVRSGEWSGELIALCGLDRRYLPPLAGSADVVGALHREAGEALGLPPGIPVVAGCADQPAQALGHGVLDPGVTLVTTGSGGQVFSPLASPKPDPLLRFHVFNHAAPGRWYALAAILSAGLSLRWLRDLLGLAERGDAYEHLSRLAGEVPPGAEGLLFLPYLAGERTPLMDPEASGVFLGLRLHHEAGHLARAVMEGVAFALASCLSLVREPGDDEQERQVVASGGGASSPVWRQIQADVFNTPLRIARGSDHAPLGAALLAGVGSGAYGSLAEGCARLPPAALVIQPDPAAAAFYRSRHRLFQDVYQHLREDMHGLARPAAIGGGE
jgi:xylulokinase